MASSSPDDDELNRVNLCWHAEHTRLSFANPQHALRLPVTVVTGALGAGKTALLYHILSNKSNLRIAAAINDFAELNIDQNLVAHHDARDTNGSPPPRRRDGGTAEPSQVIELSNGCVCCHLLQDLQTAVWKLLQTNDNAGRSLMSDGGASAVAPSLHYLVVETSGVSDPLQVIRTLDANFGKCFRARLDSVVTVVDADDLWHKTFCGGSCSSETPFSSADDATMRSQLACADVILLNKIDLLMTSEKDGHTLEYICGELEDRIRAINAHATIYRTKHCNVPLSAILDVYIPTESRLTLSHEKPSSVLPIYVSSTGGALRCQASNLVTSSGSVAAATATTTLFHTKDVVSVSVTVCEGPLSLAKIQRLLLSPLVRNLTRIKGVLWLHASASQQLHQQDGMGDGGSADLKTGASASSCLEYYRCVIHQSGRGRLGFQLDGRWKGPPLSQMAFIGKDTYVSAETLQAAFRKCLFHSDDDGDDEFYQNPHKGTLDVLQSYKEFVVVTGSLFYLSGSQVYGFSEEEIQRDLRIDTNAMNRDLADAVNASVDEPKAFLAYTIAEDDSDAAPGDKIMLCYTGLGEPANNVEVLVREAQKVLSIHFRNVHACKCGQ